MDILVAIVSAVIVGYMLFSVLFETKEEFIDCVKFWFTPDIVNLIRGQFYEDYWAEFKLWLWVAGTAGIGYGTYSLFH